MFLRFSYKKKLWTKKNSASLKSLKKGVGSGPDPLVRGTNPGIRICTKMSRIPNTDFYCRGFTVLLLRLLTGGALLFGWPSCCSGPPHRPPPPRSAGHRFKPGTLACGSSHANQLAMTNPRPSCYAIKIVCDVTRVADPLYFWKMYLDPHYSENLDPVPHLSQN